MISKLILHPFAAKTILFFLGFGLWIVFSGDGFEEDPLRVTIKSAVMALIFVFASSFMEHDEHVVYSKLNHEQEIINKIKALGFELKQSKTGQIIYSKPNFWYRKRFKIEKTDHLLKVAMPEQFVEQFEKFVR